jgi:hypothetical protein
MEMVDVLAKMDERLARQDDILAQRVTTLARMDDRLAKQDDTLRLIDTHMARLGEFMASCHHEALPTSYEWVRWLSGVDATVLLVNLCQHIDDPT